MRIPLIDALRSPTRRAAGSLGAAALLLGALPATALEPGDEAPLFTAPVLGSGAPLSLADHRGKVVYLDFWASWCAPCLVSLPLLDQLRAEFPARDFQVLAINVDREPDKAMAFLARKPVGYPSVSDPHGQLPKTFGLRTMPTSFLIDRQGVVRHVNDGFRKGDIAEIRRLVRELLGGDARPAKPGR